MKHGKYLTGLICLGLMAICLSACTNRNENSTEDASESVQMQTIETGDVIRDENGDIMLPEVT